MQKYKNGIWDLDDLVKNPSRQTFDKKIKEIQKQSEKFAKNKSQLKPNMSSKKFLQLLHEIEDITEKSSKIGGYAGLKFSEDTQSDEATALLNRISQFGSTIQNKILSALILIFYNIQWIRRDLNSRPLQCECSIQTRLDDGSKIIFDRALFRR